MDKHLLLEHRDGGAHITFNRPDVRNAISREMLAEMADFLATINGDASVRYLVFRGAGEHFAAGGDVGGFRDSLALSPNERRRSYERRLIGNSDPFLLLSRIEVPIITITRGAVAGAGLVFALAADFCYASDDSFFVFAHAGLGLPLDLGLSYFLPRAVGLRQAKALTLSSARIDAEKAQRLGIVHEVFAGDELEQHYAKLVARIANGPREAFRLSRELLDASVGSDLATQLERETRAVGQAVAHPDFVEGVSAFLERRKPAFGQSA